MRGQLSQPLLARSLPNNTGQERRDTAAEEKRAAMIWKVPTFADPKRTFSVFFCLLEAVQSLVWKKKMGGENNEEKALR